jgi:tRNA pseudouridine38-40 synthase
VHADEPAGPPPGDGGLVRVRLDLGYDGTAFAGWARQPGRRTVQETLQVALALVLRLEETRLTCAGRTDAGVHARGQVAHADLPAAAWEAAAGTLVRRLAALLPPDLRVVRAGVAPPGFDARFSALARRYAYRVSDAPHGVDPLRRHDVAWHPRPLDLPAMNLAAAALLGEHDFAAFCRRREGATTVRTLRRLSWQRDGAGLAVATVVADAFCHNLVRSLVGALLAVGSGQRPTGWPAERLALGVRDGVQVAPPHGLTLEAVRYPPDAGLAAQAGRARRRRELPA